MRIRITEERIVEADSWEQAELLFEAGQGERQHRTMVPADPEETTNAKDLWEEKARPGHTVRIVSQGVQRYWPYEATVTYEHVGVHNKRAQSANTESTEKNFLKRFKSCGVSEA